MTKKPSEAQLAARKKFGEAAKARAAKKKAENENYGVTPAPNPDASDVSLLLKRINELEKRQFFATPEAPAQQYQTRSVLKYSIKSKDYPDPRERLFQEPRLKMKNFTPTWWVLEYKVGKVNYDKDSIHYTEPRFEIELWKILETEEGEPSNEKFRLCGGIFFEDPDSFIQVANSSGIEVPEHLHKDFMDEMRYLVIRDWLLECFYPPKPTNKNKGVERVIDNRIGEVVEINSVEPVNAFAKLTKA